VSVFTSFNNPIRVTRANQLALTGSIIMPGTTAVATIYLGYAQPPPANAPQQGAILYQVNDLPGIRSL
jgi:hypothetical protein